MPYPRQLTISKDIEDAMISWLDTELTNHDAERSPYLADLASQQRDYIAKRPTAPNTFPFLNSANIIIPLTAIAFEAVHARTMQTLYALPQHVSVKLPSQFDDIDADVEKYLNRTLLDSIKIRTKMEPAIMELEKFGTGIARTGYEDITRKAVFESEDGKEEEVEVVISRGSTIDSVPNSRYLQPFQSQDPQVSPWVGEIHTFTPTQVWSLEKANFLKKGTTKSLQTWVDNQSTRDQDTQGYERALDDATNRVAILPKELTFYEIWTDYDLGKGPQAICIWYHRGSRTISSLWNNWHRDLRRPYRKGNYIPIEFRWTGIGIAKQNEQFQEEVTTQHRQRIDNATIANSQMFKVLKNSSISPNESIYPGKMWFVDSMDDIQAMPMSDVKASSYNNESQAVIFSQQRTGINELTLGMPQVGTPGTATDTGARVQESARKFDYVYGNIREFDLSIVKDTVLNLVQFGAREAEIFKYLSKGPEVEMFFKNPFDLFKNWLIMEISIVGANANKLLDRQSWQQITQGAQQYFEGLAKFAEMKQDPAIMMSIADQGMLAINEIFRQYLETFDIRNINRILYVPRPTPGGASPIPPNPNGGQAIPSTSSIPSSTTQITNLFPNQLFPAPGSPAIAV